MKALLYFEKNNPFKLTKAINQNYIYVERNRLINNIIYLCEAEEG